MRTNVPHQSADLLCMSTITHYQTLPELDPTVHTGFVISGFVGNIIGYIKNKRT